MIKAIQLRAKAPGAHTVRVVRRASEYFETVWISDETTSAGFAPVLPAIAAGVGVGVGTTIRLPDVVNPLDVASEMATIAGFVPPWRRVSLGIGVSAGGVRGCGCWPTICACDRADDVLAALAEMVELCRRLWRGETVDLREFPVTCRVNGHRPSTQVVLPWVSDADIRIVVAGGGPEVRRLAAEVADGYIVANDFPGDDLGGARRVAGGAGFATAADSHPEIRRADPASFARILGVNVSIGADPVAAKAAARQHAASILSRQSPDALERLDLEPADYAAARAAVKGGADLHDAAQLLPQRIADEFIVSGGPGECVTALGALMDQARAAGFTEICLCGPIGPDLSETVDLLTRQVLPALS